MAAKTSEWRPGPSVCRCCLTEGCYKDISTEYFWMGKREVYEEMLSDTLSINIAFSQSGGPNSNSRLICEPCISRLRDATDFRRQVLECERTFMQHLDPASSSLNVEDSGSAVDADVKLEAVKQEATVSDEDFDDHCDFLEDDDDLDEVPLTKLASKVPKKESVDLLDLLDNSQVTVKRKSTTKAKASPSKKVKITKEQKPSSSKVVNVKPEKKKKGCAETKYKWRPKCKFNDHRDNAAIILECSNVTPFRWKRGAFTCAYCSATFGDIAGIKEHLDDHPNRVEAVRFARSFSTIKVDIYKLRCELCLESMADLDTLSDHLISKHDKKINKSYRLGVTAFLIIGKDYRCPNCDAIFELFTKLNTHLTEHFPNHICSTCGKSFSSESNFKAHLVIHEDDAQQYKCSKCDKVFATRTMRNNHVTAAHQPAMRYRCPYCNEVFKNYADRGKHLRALHGTKIEYQCHLCPSVFSMCNLRTKHIQHVHLKQKKFSCSICGYQTITAGQLKSHMVKHSGEKKYKCQVCSKSYARTKTLREHMRIHNNDKRFVCQYCNNAYVQKCSLQGHIRTHHSNPELIKKVRKSL